MTFNRDRKRIDIIIKGNVNANIFNPPAFTINHIVSISEKALLIVFASNVQVIQSKDSINT